MSGHRQRRHEAQLGRPRRRAVRPQDGRAVEIAERRGPGPAAAAAAAGLLARPDDGAFRRAGLGQARGLVVGAADALQRDQRPPVRQDGLRMSREQALGGGGGDGAERLRQQREQRDQQRRPRRPRRG